MKTACIISLGCKVNQYEGNQIMRKYADEGYEIATKWVENADIYVVNTCCVTAHAEKKSRNAVARAKRLAGENPVIICGCAGDRSVNDCQTAHAIQPRQRAFIKVQDGCNNFCSYCIVPYLRGRSRSRPIPDVLAEVRENNRPTVIAGIDLSSYGLDLSPKCTLCDLCVAVNECNVPFELSSIEVGIVTPEFMNALKGCKNFIPHFHVPLQSGSDKVLRDMNRKYTAEKYLSALECIRAAFPTAQISTDVIFGYPTETPADLEQTHAVIRRAKFFHVHAFPYSNRNLERFRK